MDEIYTRIRGIGKRWLWLAIDPLSKVILSVHVDNRRAVDAQALVHDVTTHLKADNVPVFLTDGLRAYFDALTAHFGRWVRQLRARKEKWQVDARLQCGQTHTRMVCGDRRTLRQHLLDCGLSGQIQTAFIERVNLTIRQSIALLARRTWSVAQSETHPLRHVQWWQAYYHLVRPHESLSVSLLGLTQRTRQRTPAMALGLTDHVWNVGQFMRTPLIAA